VFVAGSLSAQTLKTPKAPKAPKPPQVEVPAPPEPPAPPAPPSFEEETFKVVEEMPRFPGCEDMDGTKAEIKACANEKLMEYISSNLKYPEEARKDGIEGTILIQYAVTSKGEVDQVTLMRDIGGGCGEAGMAVFKKMQEEGILWIPGKQRGKPVNVQLTLPVKFSL
jgi:protein TonB